LKVIETDLPSVLIIEPDWFPDERGFFMETFNATRYAEAGLDRVFVQDNHSQSTHGVIRGLHYQLNRPQGKFVYVARGEIFDVAVDIRRGSPTFGRWTGMRLSAENKKQFFIPEGFAHGFSVLSDMADVLYKCTDIFQPGDSYGILFSDPRIGIDWQVENPCLSEKDAILKNLQDTPPETLPVFKT
jgi:dTDP-4-dehydrorhamnose 3,5-epimerase